MEKVSKSHSKIFQRFPIGINQLSNDGGASNISENGEVKINKKENFIDLPDQYKTSNISKGIFINSNNEKYPLNTIVVNIFDSDSDGMRSKGKEGEAESFKNKQIEGIVNNNKGIQFKIKDKEKTQSSDKENVNNSVVDYEIVIKEEWKWMKIMKRKRIMLVKMMI